MYILGISAYYHDSAAALLKDGAIVAAVQEERLSRIKHDRSFPILSIETCMRLAGICKDDIDYIIFYEKPFWKFERIFESITHHVPFSFFQFIKAIPLWVNKRLWIGPEIRDRLQFNGKVLYASHHQSHAAAAFYHSGFKSSAILTLDGVGEYATSSIATGDGGKIRMLKEQHFPHSVGLLYSAFTQYCGFKVNSGEYKLMGLAAYGRPLYKELIFHHLVTQYPDGSFSLDMSYFHYTEGLKLINKKFINLFGRIERKDTDHPDAFYCDVAASIQAVIEEMVLQILEHVRDITGASHLVFSGGVALNCKLNQKIVESGIFKEYYFHFNPGDSGCAGGAAYLCYYDNLQNGFISSKPSVFLGDIPYQPEEPQSIRLSLDKLGAPYSILSENVKEISGALAAGKIIAYMNGRMEFGPRALGHRSILADPRNPDMKDILNRKIKRRESFRPFAPSVLEEYAVEFFELGPANYDTMMVTATAKEGTAALMSSAIHIDGTARIHIVSRQTDQDFYDLIHSFYLITGCPALINTSFNIRGEPIVNSVEDALHTFLYSDIDILVLENQFLIAKTMNLDTVRARIKPKTIPND
jgi:carbamoyltransferase